MTHFVYFHDFRKFFRPKFRKIRFLMFFFKLKFLQEFLIFFSKFRMRWIALSLLYRYVMIIHHSLTMGVDQIGRMTTCKSRALICNLVS